MFPASVSSISRLHNIQWSKYRNVPLSRSLQYSGGLDSKLNLSKYIVHWIVINALIENKAKKRYYKFK